MSEGTENLRWITASTGGQCVEVAMTDDSVLVRDSKSPDGPRLEFTPAEWDVFLAGARAGTFDR